jgi:hypothetical protein
MFAIGLRNFFSLNTVLDTFLDTCLDTHKDWGRERQPIIGPYACVFQIFSDQGTI